MITSTWTDRLDAILADPVEARKAAAVYYLVKSTMEMPITRKRQCREEQIYDEALGIIEFDNEYKGATKK